MIESFSEKVVSRDRALKLLEKLKKLEKELCKYSEVLDNGLIVSCKNKDLIEQYKKLK